MEVRCFSHLHFIQAVRGGSVIKVLNVNSRGQSALTFKKVSEIYGPMTAKTSDSLPKRQIRDDRKCSLSKRYLVEIESPCPVSKKTKVVKDEPETSSFYYFEIDGNGKKSDIDDKCLDDMTLNQIMKRCKTRERKRSKSVGSSKETDETCFHQNQDYSYLRSDTDSHDLEVPLSLWKSKPSRKKKTKSKRSSDNVPSLSQETCFHHKQDFSNLQSDNDCYEFKVPLSILKSKLSRKKKAKSKHCRGHDSTSSQSVLSVVKSEQMLNLSPSCSEIPSSLNIKVEIVEPDSSGCQMMNNVGEELSLVCDEKVGSCGSAEPDRANQVIFGGELSTSFRKELECWDLMEKEPEYWDLKEKEPQCWDLIETCNEYMEPDDPEPIQIIWDTGRDTLRLDYPEINGLDSYFTTSGSSEEGYDVFPTALALTEDRYSVLYFSQHDSTEHDMICQHNSDMVPRLDMAGHNRVQCEELSCSSDVIEDEIKDKLPSSLGESDTPGLVGDCNLGRDNHLVSGVDNSYLGCEKQFPISSCSGTEINYSPTVHQLNTADASANSVGNGHFPHPMMHRPQRLLSTRKAISPTSQERLCKAKESIELHDKKLCRGKLWFGKQHKNKVAEGGTGNRITGFSTSPNQLSKRSKKDNRGSHLEGTVNVPLSCGARRDSTGCTSVQSCSESAIAFAQRQMQDVETIAMKLTNELNSMKAIVEERLHEANTTTSLKYNDHQRARIAIANTTRVEASARKWLSMMARDCNRFCKIMRMTGQVSPASENAFIKKRKTISFADEAGGKLCEVKIIEDDDDSDNLFSI